MDDIKNLSLKIDKLESEHNEYVKFSAGCFIGIFGTGIMIDHHYDPMLWLVLLILTVSLVATIVIAVKKSLKKDQYLEELRQLQSIPSQEAA